VAWYGRGPHECYPDRQSGAPLRRHAVDDVAALHVPYIMPGASLLLPWRESFYSYGFSKALGVAAKASVPVVPGDGSGLHRDSARQYSTPQTRIQAAAQPVAANCARFRIRVPQLEAETFPSAVRAVVSHR